MPVIPTPDAAPKPQKISAFFSLQNFKTLKKSPGMWDHHMPNGQGLWILSNGGFIIGTFRDGKACGVCTMKYPNGDFILGQFLDGYLDGKCMKYRLAKNTTRVEVYKLGALREVLETHDGIPEEKLLKQEHMSDS
jgi:hypothetical protein